MFPVVLGPAFITNKQEEFHDNQENTSSLGLNLPTFRR